MRNIAIANSKGGVGKTTTTANLGAALAKSGKKVLLVDMDPQQSLTDFFLVDVDEEDTITLKDLLLSNRIKPTEAIVNIDKNLDILPIHEEILAHESAFSKIKNGYFLLKELLEKLDDQYDYCLIDCSPGVNMFLGQSLVAAHDVIVPLKPNDVDAKATENFLTVFATAKELNPKLTISGVLLTMVKTTSKRHSSFEKIFKGHEFQKRVMGTKIRDTVSLGCSSTKGQSIFHYDPRSIGAEDYAKLGKEIIKWKR